MHAPTPDVQIVFVSLSPINTNVVLHSRLDFQSQINRYNPPEQYKKNCAATRISTVPKRLQPITIGLRVLHKENVLHENNAIKWNNSTKLEKCKFHVNQNYVSRWKYHTLNVGQRRKESEKHAAPGARNANHQKMAVRQAMVTREWLASSGSRLKRFDLVGSSSPLVSQKL